MINTVDTVDTTDTVDTVDTVDMVYTVVDMNHNELSNHFILICRVPIFATLDNIFHSLVMIVLCLVF